MNAQRLAADNAPASALGQRDSNYLAPMAWNTRPKRWRSASANGWHRARRAIAVVVQDRLVARRARALLERAEVLVQDETGWTLSTTSASTVLMRWLDNLDSQFHFQDLLDLLKSPFIFSAWDAARRRSAVYRLEQLIRKHSVVSHLHRYRVLAGEDAGSAGIAAEFCTKRSKNWTRKNSARSRPGCKACRRALMLLEIQPGLQRDQAGEQVLQPAGWLAPRAGPRCDLVPLCRVAAVAQPAAGRSGVPRRQHHQPGGFHPPRRLPPAEL